MVMNFDASLAVAAVERARRLVNIARLADADLDFFALYNGDAFFVNLLIARALELVLTRSFARD